MTSKYYFSLIVAALIAGLPLILPIGAFWVFSLSSLIFLTSIFLKNISVHGTNVFRVQSNDLIRHAPPLIIFLLSMLFLLGMYYWGEINTNGLGVVVGLILSLFIYYVILKVGLSKNVLFFAFYLCAIIGGNIAFLDYFLIGVSRTGGIYSAMMFGPIGSLLFVYFFNYLVFHSIKEDQFKWSISVIGFVFSFLMVIASGTKISVLFLLIILTIEFFYFRAWKHKIFYYGVSVAVLVTILSFDKIRQQPIYSRMQSGYTTTWQYVFEGRHDIKSSPTVRIEMWRAGWEIFIDNPIFGVGTEKMYRLVKEVSLKNQFTYSITHNESHLHNDYVDILVRYGLVGLALFLSLYLLAFYIFFTNRWMPNFYKACYLSYLVGFLTFGISGATYTYIFGEIFIFGGIPVLIALVLHNRPKYLEQNYS